MENNNFKGVTVILTYTDPRLDKCLDNTHYLECDRISKQIIAFMKISPLTKEQYKGTRGFMFTKFDAFMDINEDLQVMVPANVFVMTTSCFSLKRAIIGLIRSQSTYSRVLYISSACLSTTAAGISLAAVLSGVDFVPRASMGCNVAARYLNRIAQRLAEAAEMQFNRTERNDMFSGIQNDDEPTGFFSGIRRRWRQFRNPYSNKENNAHACHDMQIQMNPDENLVLGPLQDNTKIVKEVATLNIEEEKEKVAMIAYSKKDIILGPVEPENIFNNVSNIIMP